MTSVTVPAFAPDAAGVTPREGVALPELLGILRRRWRAVAIPTCLACLGAVVFVQAVTPRYTGEAKILLESRDSAFTRPNQERSDQPAPLDEQGVASQVQVVMSRDLAREAIKRLGLVGNPEFDPGAGIGPIRGLLTALGLVPEPARDPADRVLDRYFDHLAVYPAGKSRILTIEFRARDPELAAKGANTVAELYLASLEAAKMDTARFASTWLGSNVEGLRSRVADAEAKVEAFRAKNGLFAGGATNQPIGTQQLTELSTQLVQARANQADAVAKAKLIKDLIKDGRAFDIPDVSNNEMMRRLVEQRITLRAQLALESRTLLPGHPRIKELTAQLNDLEGQIRAASDRVVRTLESDARIASARVETLQAAVDGQSGVVAKANSSEVQLRALEREAKAQRDQLESYLSRYREAAARDAEAAAPPDARVVSRAAAPDTPSFPKKLPIIGFTTIAALLFSAGAVVARQLLGASAPDAARGAPTAGAEVVAPAAGRDEDDAPADAEAPAGPAPSKPARRGPRIMSRVAKADPPVALVEEARAEAEPTVPTAAEEPAVADAASPFDLVPLLARIEALTVQEGHGRRVLIAGAEQASSSAAIVDSLAQAVAQRGRALVVRLDGAPSDQPGLTDLVQGQAAFLEAIQSRPGSRLHEIGLGTADATILAAEPRGLAITLDALAQAYDWVLCRIEATSVGNGEQLLRLCAAKSDAVVLASNAAADDPALVTLYEAAKSAGAGDVIVAQDREPVQAVARARRIRWPMRHAS